MTQTESHFYFSWTNKIQVYRIPYVAKYLRELLNNAAGFAVSLSLLYMTNSMLCVKMEYRNENGSGHF